MFAGLMNIENNVVSLWIRQSESVTSNCLVHQLMSIVRHFTWCWKL